MRDISTAAALVASALIATAAQAQSADRKADDRALAEAKPVGEAISCIQLNMIRNTRVRSDNVIDFVMRDRQVYRNTLPMSCSPLGFEERFGYKTSIGRLCSTDTITVLPQGSSIPGPTCGLGKFQPIELPSD